VTDEPGFAFGRAGIAFDVGVFYDHLSGKKKDLMAEVATAFVVFVGPENATHPGIDEVADSEVDRPEVVAFELIKHRVSEMFHEIEVGLFRFGSVECAIGVKVFVGHFVGCWSG